MKPWPGKAWTTREEFLAFVLMGGINAALTYGVYLLLLFVMPYPFAYSGSYVTGIFVSYYLNARFVFREALSLRKALQYPAVYIIQYFFGLALLYLLVEFFHLNKTVAPLAVVLVSVPLTFLMSRYVIRGRPKAEDGPSQAIRLNEDRAGNRRG